MGQNASKSFSKWHQKAFRNRFSDAFPHFWTHICFPKNQHFNLIWKELYGIIATIVVKNNVDCRHFCNP